MCVCVCFTFAGGFLSGATGAARFLLLGRTSGAAP